MCLVIDNNMAGDYIAEHEYLIPILKYIESGGKMAFNASLLKEYPYKLVNLAMNLKKVGRGILIQNEKLPNNIKNNMTSDDPHILALIANSSTRVVCTKDSNLIDDLKNPLFFNKPRCKVYQHQGSSSVLDGCCT